MKFFTMLCAAALAALATHAAAVGRLADVTVFDRNENRQLPIHWHEGRAWVVGKPGNEYAVRVRNRGREDVLAVISVDGVNVVTGETATPQQSGYVLSPWRLLDLAGWRKDLTRTAAFYFTPLPDSYAARTGRPDNVGVIGVALFRKKQPAEIGQIAPLPPSPRPFQRSEASRDSRDASEARSPAAGAASPAPESAPAEAQDAARAQAPAAKLGTGHGRSETSHARYVSFERATPEPAEVVTIYYDSHRNLVARGVIREPRPLPHLHPSPFPGFVPDPGA
jgi:hypothetical protein